MCPNRIDLFNLDISAYDFDEITSRNLTLSLSLSYMIFVQLITQSRDFEGFVALVISKDFNDEHKRKNRKRSVNSIIQFESLLFSSASFGFIDLFVLLQALFRIRFIVRHCFEESDQVHNHLFNQQKEKMAVLEAQKQDLSAGQEQIEEQMKAINEEVLAKQTALSKGDLYVNKMLKLSFDLPLPTPPAEETDIQKWQYDYYK